MKSIGFTGTQRGMTGPQRQTVHNALLLLHWARSTFHDGLCEGADHEAAHLAYNAGYILIGHPGPRPDPFAIKHKEVREPLPNLERNRIIVRKATISSLLRLETRRSVVAVPGQPSDTLAKRVFRCSSSGPTVRTIGTFRFDENPTRSPL
jgi:hypothetical protein